MENDCEGEVSETKSNNTRQQARAEISYDRGTRCTYAIACHYLQLRHTLKKSKLIKNKHMHVKSKFFI